MALPPDAKRVVTRSGGLPADAKRISAPSAPSEAVAIKQAHFKPESPLKTSVRTLLGEGLSQFIPGLESPTMQLGVKASENIADTATRGLPQEPNINFGKLGNLNPRSGARGLLSGILDPRSVASMRLGKPGIKAEMLPGYFEMVQVAKAKRLRSKAQGILEDILQPNKAELKEAIKRDPKSGTVPAISKGIEYVKKSKSFEELTGVFKQVKDKLNKAISGVRSESKQPMTSGYMDEAMRMLREAKNEKIYNPAEIARMESRIWQELDYLNENLPKLDTLDAQARKVALQDMTQRLIDRSRKGLTSMNDPVVDQVEDSFRRGLKAEIERADQRIKGMNEDLSALIDAEDLAASQATTVREAPKFNMIQKLSEFVRPTKLGTTLALARKTFGRKIPLSQKTGEIENLVKQILEAERSVRR